MEIENNFRKSVRSLAIKFYWEQIQGLPNGEADLYARVRACDKEVMHVICIKHDRDTVPGEDGFWCISSVKPHYHVYVWLVNSKNRMHISTVLKRLGITYRQGIDDDLLAHRAIDTIHNGFAECAMYATHETPKAVASGKARYDVSEIVSNLTSGELDQVREGYVPVADVRRKYTYKDFDTLAPTVYQLGYLLKPFEEWYCEQPFSLRVHRKARNLREVYERGVTDRLADRSSCEVERLCIYIQGPKNSGRTYAVGYALDGERVLSVGGGELGRFDSLSMAHTAIVIDDDKCPDLLNMTDNYICQVYRRGSSNPVWAGTMFVVTSEQAFEDWAENCGLQVYRTNAPRQPDFYTEQFQAVLSRFFVCHLEYAGRQAFLICDKPSVRGTVPDQLRRTRKFKDFQSRFNAVIAGYDSSADKGAEAELAALRDEISKPEDIEALRHQGEKKREDDAKIKELERLVGIWSEYQARLANGEPVVMVGDTLCFKAGFTATDWCNPNRSQEDRDRLQAEARELAAKWYAEHPDGHTDRR